jgi:hypothetical protein
VYSSSFDCAYGAKGPTDLLIWDTGSTQHLTPRKHLLHDFRHTNAGQYVKYGGNEKTHIFCTGTLFIRSSVNGNTSDFRIPGVSLVKAARHTLLSARQLLHQTGLTFTAKGSTGTLTRDGKLGLPLSRIDGLYTVRGELIPSTMANVADSSTSPGLKCKFWHARLGHASAGVMHILELCETVGDKPYPWEDLTEELPENWCRSRACRLFSSCLSKDPTERPSAQELLSRLHKLLDNTSVA